jgi:hypothetical protein
MAGNIAQVLVTFIIAAFIYIYTGFALSEFFKELNGNTVPEHEIFQCLSSFHPESCYFPESNGTSPGLAVCSNINVRNSTCISNFANATGETYDLMCGIFEEGVQQLPPPASLYFDECPNLSFPFPNLMYAISEDSTKASYCASPMSFCTTPKATSDGLQIDVCVLGASYKNPIPFQFLGDLCSNYTIMESLLDDKEMHDLVIAAQKELYYPKEWM